MAVNYWLISGGFERVVTMKKKIFNVRVLVICAVMSAIGVVLAFFIHFPIIPAVPFLEYDPADILIFMSTYSFGIPVGLAMTVVVAVVQGLTVSASSGFTGILMHFVSTGGYVLAAGLIYKLVEKAMRKSSAPRTAMEITSLAGSTLVGIGTTVGLMTIWNIWLTPIFMGIDRQLLIDNFLYLIVIFNVIKISINGVAAAIYAVPFRRLAYSLTGRTVAEKDSTEKVSGHVDTMLGFGIILAELVTITIIILAIIKS